MLDNKKANDGQKVKTTTLSKNISSALSKQAN